MDSGASDLLEICSNVKPVIESGRQAHKGDHEKQGYEFNISLISRSSRAPITKSLSHLEAKELGFHSPESVTGN